MQATRVQGASFVNTESVSSTLTDLMREKVNDIHRKVEMREFMVSLLRGTTTKETYFRYLLDLKFVFETLEYEIGKRRQYSYTSSSPDIEKLWIPEIFRRRALIEDLKNLNCTLGLSLKEPSQAAAGYCLHLREIAARSPHLLIAHIYTQYLAILFGGQMMRKKVEDKWGSNAVAFYQFETALSRFRVSNTQELALKIKEIINTIRFSDSERKEIIDEAMVAFQLTDGMLAALEQRVGSAGDWALKNLKAKL